MDKLSKLKVSELLELCNEKNISIKKKSKKKDIIKTILEFDSKTQDSKVEKPVVAEVSDEPVVVEVSDGPVEQPDEPMEEEAALEVSVEPLEQPEECIEEPVSVEVTEEDNKVSEKLSELNKKYETLVELISVLSKRVDELENFKTENIVDSEQNIIDEKKYVKKDNDFNILKTKNNESETEVINTLNELYKIGIRFKNIIDTNCYDDTLIKYIKERGYECDGVSLINQVENCSITDLNLSEYKDNTYDMVICFNLFEYLTDNDIKLYYKNLLRISNCYIIVKININETDKKLEHYMNLFNNIVNEQEVFVVQRFITKNLPKNLFILRKEIIKQKNIDKK
jgi:hypothetical protein